MSEKRLEGAWKIGRGPDGPVVFHYRHGPDFPPHSDPWWNEIARLAAAEERRRILDALVRRKAGR